MKKADGELFKDFTIMFVTISAGEKSVKKWWQLFLSNRDSPSICGTLIG